MKRTIAIGMLTVLVVVVMSEFPLLATLPAGRPTTQATGPDVERLVQLAGDLRSMNGNMRTVHAERFSDEVWMVMLYHGTGVPPYPIVVDPKTGERTVATSQPALTDEVVAEFYDVAAKIIEICGSAEAAKSGVSAELSKNLLVTVAVHCPSATIRVEAARLLVVRAVSGGDGWSKPFEAPSDALTVTESVIKYMLGDECPKKDRLKALKLAEMVELWPRAVSLFALSNSSRVKATEKSITEYVEKLEAALIESQKAATDDDVQAQLKRLSQQLVELRKSGEIKQVAEEMAIREAVRPLMERFAEAVNNEDVDAMKKCLTPTTVKKLGKELAKPDASLKALVAEDTGLRVKVKEIRFVGIKSLRKVGQETMVDVQLEFIGEDGKSKVHELDMEITKIKDQWLIGEPK